MRTSLTRRLLHLSVVFAAAFLVYAGASAANAQAASQPWWWIGAEAAPTHLSPPVEGNATPKDEITVVVSDLAPVPASGASKPVVITDTLPEGLHVIGVKAAQPENQPKPLCTTTPLRCEYTGVVNPSERLAMAVEVQAERPSGTTLENQMRVEGGGAPHPATATQQLTISGKEAPFGVQPHGFQIQPFDEDGTPSMLAGSHPFELTNTLVMNQKGTEANREPIALPKELDFGLPAGLVGDPNATEQCDAVDFNEPVNEANLCPAGSVVGIATAMINEPNHNIARPFTVPVFNLVPAQGEPARFGFEVLGLVFITIDTSVRTGGDYSVVASSRNTDETAGVLSSQVTLWGVPGDPRHNPSRGWECVDGGHFALQVKRTCPANPEPLPQTPFLTLPGSCATNPATEPVRSIFEADSWTDQLKFPLPEPTAEYDWTSEEGQPLGFEGCGELLFEPSIHVTSEAEHAPAVHSGSTPTGLTLNVHVPQQTTTEANLEGRAEADVKSTTVTLPAGVQVNPSAANGLQACSEHQIGYEGFNAKTGIQEFTPAPMTCPKEAKVGIVHIQTPLLPHELEGELFLAEPAPNGEGGKNPFNSLVALYLVAEDPVSGVLVKLPGRGAVNETTGQVTTSFEDTPQLPFEELRAELFGGPRASLSTPAFCGEYPTQATFTSWAAPTQTLLRSSGGEFAIVEGCASGGPLGFSPVFSAQSLNTAAGGFTSFSLGLERADGQQALTGLTVHLPAGISALLSSLTPCPEPLPGQLWACGEGSLIGHSTVWSGVGDEPVVLGGDVYLTSGYDGAPFGILVATEAKAGPFDLGMVYVRSRIDVNPETAAVTIATDPGPHGDVLPTRLRGIPVQLKQLNVTVDRSRFELNPTSCDPMSVAGTLDGDEGATVGVSSPFKAEGCGSLSFAPSLSASTSGLASKANGASFVVRVISQGLGVANIKKVDLQLPKQMPSRLSTIQKACVAAVFEVNPAACDEGSVIGFATIHTPVFTNPLSGPAYLVSHGGAAFPDVEFVLQGEGVKILLDGKTQIKSGITYSKFESAPDAPFTTFETVLPAGPHSALTANVAEKKHYDLCGEKLSMPTTIVAQDGAAIEQTTKIAVQGCKAVKAAKAKKLTRAQKLTNALKACRKQHKHSRKRRLACETQAHKRYAVKKGTDRAKKTAGHKGH
jgi:hypothetical protein